MANERIDSTSDERVQNNVMRHDYRVLSDVEKQQMKIIKDLGLLFIQKCDAIGFYTAGLDGTPVPAGSRELSLAKTKIEEAVFWAVKHITR